MSPFLCMLIFFIFFAIMVLFGTGDVQSYRKERAARKLEAYKRRKEAQRKEREEKEKAEKGDGEGSKSTASTVSANDNETSKKFKPLTPEEKKRVGEFMFKKYIDMVRAGDDVKKVCAAVNSMKDEYYKSECKQHLKEHYDIDLGKVTKQE